MAPAALKRKAACNNWLTESIAETACLNVEKAKNKDGNAPKFGTAPIKVVDRVCRK